MFVYEDNDTYKGFTSIPYDVFGTTWGLKISAFSVDKTFANKKLKVRKTVGTILSWAFIAAPIVAGIISGVHFNSWGAGIGFGVLTIVIAFFAYLFDAGDGIEDLINDSVFYDKYSIMSENKHYNVDHADYAYGINVSSTLFGDCEDQAFWKKFLSLTDKELLKEATEIMILEYKLKEISLGTYNYLTESRGSILEDEIKEKRNLVSQKQVQLSERFETFVENVLSHVDNEKDIAVLKLVEGVEDIKI